MNKNSNLTGVLLPFVDLIIINIALIVSFIIRYPDKAFIADVQYLNLLFFYNINWLFCTYLFGAYKPYRISSIEKILKSVLQSIFLHILIVAAFWVFIKGYYYSRQILFTSYGIILIAILLWRISYLYYQFYVNKSGKNRKKVVILGKSESSLELSYFFNKNPQFGYAFEGFFDEEKTDGVIGTVAELRTYALDNNIEEIYCLSPKYDDEAIADLRNFAENNTIRLKIVPDIKSMYYSKSKIDFYGNTPVLLIKEFPLDHPTNQIWKRIFDILFSFFVILLIFSWLFPIIALLIKIDSRGPIFFVQQRSGKDKNAFGCFKFRSMSYSNNSEFVQATKNDARITKVGRFIRKTSIDEMPQFFNVFMGQMSVVGPRPHPLKLDDMYRDNIDKYMFRHFVKPGITGLSQIMGYRGETKEDFAMKARINLDNFYIEHWSFFLDLKIIVLTVFNVFKKEENAF